MKTIEPKTKKRVNKVESLFGLLMLFVCASIVYSSYVIFMGVDGLTPKLLVAPQAIFAALILVNKFIK